MTSKNFDIPTDWYDFRTTCLITELNGYLGDFLKDSEDLKLLSAWGHSSDLDTSETFGWDEMETFCKNHRREKRRLESDNRRGMRIHNGNEKA
ncbi:MAG: hypothetical protein L6V93_17945 [Clostridiales bacterium]|nr:MAG: hypothetical protein L6V93_17945 [Clostridiales bacterium]